jgi:hypothetical protein
LGLEDLVVDMDEIAVPRKELADIVNDSSEVLVEGFQIAIPTLLLLQGQSEPVGS